MFLPLLVINTLSFGVVLCVLWHLMFLMAIGKAERCLAGCQVTKCKFDKISLLCSTNCLGALDC